MFVITNNKWYRKAVAYRGCRFSGAHTLLQAIVLGFGFAKNAPLTRTTFEKVDETFGCMSFVAVYISPAIKENLL